MREQCRVCGYVPPYAGAHHKCGRPGIVEKKAGAMSVLADAYFKAVRDGTVERKTITVNEEDWGV